MNIALLVGNDQLLEVYNVRDEITGDYIDDADVQASIRSCLGRLVDGFAWPLDLVHINAEDDLEERRGLYRGILQQGLDLMAGQEYIITVDIQAGADDTARFEWKVLAINRTPV